MEDFNPYASTTNTDPIPASFDEPRGERFVVAGHGARIVNLIFDYVAIMGFGFTVGVTIVIVGGEEAGRALQSIPDFLVGLPIVISYYFTCEATTGRTLGKLISGTKVVDEDGNPPGIGQIFGRTLGRLIPFEAFSCLGTPPRGWHDSLSKTYVVKA